MPPDLWTLAFLKDFDLLVEHLCEDTGFTPTQIRDLSDAPDRYWYREAPKHSGGKRNISEPKPYLRRVQDVLRFDIQQLDIHEAAHGYVQGRNPRTAVEPHAGAEVLVTCDTKNFYEHITRERVVARLREQGACASSAVLIANLCTDRDRLPQGTPTSPALANTVSYHFDEAVAKKAAQHGFAYTRYVDDLLFSRQQPGSRRVVKILLAQVRKLLHHYASLWGPQLSRGVRVPEYGQLHKVKIARPHQRQEALSLVLNATWEGPWARVPREERRRLRAALHQQAQGDSPLWSDATIAGKKAYVAQVMKEASPEGDGPR